MLEMTEAAMKDSKARGARRGAEIRTLEQQAGDPPTSRLKSESGAVDPAADDDQVETPPFGCGRITPDRRARLGRCGWDARAHRRSAS